MSTFLAKQLLRFLSVAMAIILWFYVLNSEPIEASKRIKIAYLLPQGKAISNEVPQELEVRVKGARAFLRSLYDQEEAVIDLSKMPTSDDHLSVTLGPDYLPSSFGVSVISISPKIIDVALDRIIRKEIPARENFVGELPHNYRLISHTLTPNKVMISGPISLMRKTVSIKTEPIDYSRLLSEKEFKVSLEQVDPRIHIETASSLLFRHELRAQEANQLYKDIPLRFTSSNRRFFAKTENVTVSLLAAPMLNVSRNDIQAVIDIPEGKKGWMRLKVKVLLPPDVHLLKVEPEEISVKVK